MNIFGSSGDLGDVVASLPSVRALGGGKMVFFNREDGHRESLRGARYEALKSLLEAQPYILGTQWSDEVPFMSHDFSTFRQGLIQGEDLATWQARHLKVRISLDPWLTALRSPKALGRPVFARSMRYRNPKFPWRSVMSHYRNGVFVGLPEEHRDFQICNGCQVEFAPTQNLLEVAEIINGASIFIGNQSCPFWIAAGLGVPLVQETFPQSPNSMIRRPNARYLMTPPFNFP